MAPERRSTVANGLLFGVDASRAAIRRQTGTEAYATHLVRELIELTAQRGHRLRLYFNQPPPAGLFAEAAHVEMIVIPFARLWTHLRLGRELQRCPPDLFFTPAHVIPLSYKGPAVATVHDLGFHYFPKAHTRFQRIYLRWSTLHNARRSRQLLADSQATKGDLATLYGIDPGKVVVAYPTIDPALAPIEDERLLADVRRRYGIEGPYFLYLGTLQPRKNVERLVDAYVQSGVAAQLVLAGKPGWLSESIMARISRAQREKGQTDKIRVTGYVAEEDKAALLSGATALLFPSLYEGFGFPILEAQRCNTAVLCANNSSQPEVAGEGALQVDARDVQAIAQGIRRMMDEEALRRRLIEAGAKNVGRFSWRQSAETALDVLETAAKA